VSDGRRSQTILLCEDDPQERLVRSYLKECGLNTEPPYLLPRNASREVHGGNVGWVIREFSKELQACRQRHATQANTLLIVVADADDITVIERRGHLVADPPVAANDPLVILIPRRHVETWIRAATRHKVTETDDCKNPEPRKSDVREAAAAIHGWARNAPTPGPTCVPSLLDALPAWRTIG
jgi:hypothetical protein